MPHSQPYSIPNTTRCPQIFYQDRNGIYYSCLSNLFHMDNSISKWALLLITLLWPRRIRCEKMTNDYYRGTFELDIHCNPRWSCKSSHFLLRQVLHSLQRRRPSCQKLNMTRPERTRTSIHTSSNLEFPFFVLQQNRAVCKSERQSVLLCYLRGSRIKFELKSCSCFPCCILRREHQRQCEMPPHLEYYNTFRGNGIRPTFIQIQTGAAAGSGRGRVHPVCAPVRRSGRRTSVNLSAHFTPHRAPLKSMCSHVLSLINPADLLPSLRWPMTLLNSTWCISSHEITWDQSELWLHSSAAFIFRKEHWAFCLVHTGKIRRFNVSGLQPPLWVQHGAAPQEPNWTRASAGSEKALQTWQAGQALPLSPAMLVTLIMFLT